MKTMMMVLMSVIMIMKLVIPVTVSNNCCRRCGKWKRCWFCQRQWPNISTVWRKTFVSCALCPTHLTGEVVTCVYVHEVVMYVYVQYCCWFFVCLGFFFKENGMGVKPSWTAFFAWKRKRAMGAGWGRGRGGERLRGREKLKKGLKDL